MDGRMNPFFSAAAWKESNKHVKIYILFFVCVHSRVMIVVVSERIQYAYANTNPTFLAII